MVFGEQQPLRGLEADTVDVGHECEQRRQLLAALHQSEFGSLLDGVGSVETGVGETDDLRLRALRLKQER